MNNCYFCSTNAIFEIQMLFFWCAEQKKFERAVQTFAAFWREFCRRMTRVLPPYKQVLPPYGPVLKKECSTKVSCIF